MDDKIPLPLQFGTVQGLVAMLECLDMDALIKNARAGQRAMAAEGIRVPQRFALMLAPGRWAAP